MCWVSQRPPALRGAGGVAREAQEVAPQEGGGGGCRNESFRQTKEESTSGHAVIATYFVKVSLKKGLVILTNESPYTPGRLPPCLNTGWKGEFVPKVHCKGCSWRPWCLIASLSPVSSGGGSPAPAPPPYSCGPFIRLTSGRASPLLFIPDPLRGFSEPRSFSLPQVSCHSPPSPARRPRILLASPLPRWDPRSFASHLQYFTPPAGCWSFLPLFCRGQLITYFPKVPVTSRSRLFFLFSLNISKEAEILEP